MSGVGRRQPHLLYTCLSILYQEIVLMITSKFVFLWTTPRCASTAVEFSISTLPNVKTYHEPFHLAFRQKWPLKFNVDLHTSQPSHEYSYENTIVKILDNSHGKDVVFVKDHAKFIRDNFDILLDKRLLCFTHTFLIRHPIKSILSFYNKDPVNFKHWYEHKEIGFTDLYDLYSYLNQHLGISPVIIEADELLTNPEKMMEAYCNVVGITYKEGMTKWEPGSMDTQEFQDQKYFSLKWSDTALKSSGLMKPGPLPVIPEGLPEEVYKCIEESLVPYNKLYSLRLKTS